MKTKNEILGRIDALLIERSQYEKEAFDTDDEERARTLWDEINEVWGEIKGLQWVILE